MQKDIDIDIFLEKVTEINVSSPDRACGNLFARAPMRNVSRDAASGQHPSVPQAV